MSLERSLAIVLLLLAGIYGYTAFFVLDASLPPFAKMSPIWPSSFPKIIAVAGILLSLLMIFSPSRSDKKPEIDLKQPQRYQWQPAVALLVMMIAYALLLRPIGFVVATFGFLVIGAIVLGEKKLPRLIIIAVICSLGIWYLVQEVLGIYLRPWPWFLSGGL